MLMRTLGRAALVAWTLLLVGASLARAAPLNAVLEAEVVTLDPHLSSAYITRTFGYMVFDTLFAPDSGGAIKPQMVGAWSVSDDRLTWRFTLRDGLRFHDGQAVTAADVVASLKRWAGRNMLGGRLMALTSDLRAADAKTFVLTLREPYGLVLETLGATVGPVPFIMPERLARTPGTQQVAEVVGSGPFVYDKAQHVPGAHMLLRRNPDYVPRSEPADFLAGGKNVKVEAVDIRVLPDGATAAAALQNGEIDYMQYAPFDLIPTMQRDAGLRLISFAGPQMFTGAYRVNAAQPPFDDPAIRRVLLDVVDQKEVLDGLGLDAKFAQTCDEFFICGSPYASDNPAAPRDHSVAAAAKALRATKYHGEPVVVMIIQDLEAPRVATTILADRLKRAGFVVDAQVMDWATLLQRRTQRGGWNVYGVHALGLDLQSPLTNTVIGSNCQNSPASGFMCEKEMVPLFDAFSRASDVPAQRAVAGRIQAIVYDQALAVPFGQFAQPAAYRAALTGLLPSAIPLFWSVEKR